MRRCPAQVVEVGSGGEGGPEEEPAEGPYPAEEPLVREHNLYVKHFTGALDSAALRAMFEVCCMRQARGTSSCLAHRRGSPKF